MVLSLLVDNLPENRLAYSNRVFVSQQDFEVLKASVPKDGSSPKDPKMLISLDGDAVFTASPHPSVPLGKIALNGLQRRSHTPQLTLNTEVKIAAYVPDGMDVALSALSCSLDCDKLSEDFRRQFVMSMFMPGQELAMDHNGAKLKVIVEAAEHAINDGRKPRFGLFLEATAINWSSPSGASLRLSGQKSGAMRTIIPKDFDFVKLGIGGLNNEFNQIFRRAFASRIYPTHLVEQMGINHVRGMLLYGPPGCGKTLVARQIGKVLQAREPKIVNGPEVLDKYVGGSEEKIRALFKEAEEEQRSEGENSMLHIIIFDEIDAICKTRGSSRDSTGVSDSIVNQLLSKIDGVDSLNNVLIIGMTNRKDMIDDALLRPGRLEVHVEIGLPDETGRLQIITIHTSKMKEHGRIDTTALEHLPELARRTKNFSGAEIEGLVKSAASYAFHRNVDVKDLSKAIDETTLCVMWQDFELALCEIQPKFGANNEELSAMYRNGIVHYGPAFEDISSTLRRLVEQTRTSERTPLMSVLLEGSAFTGKTAVAASTAVDSGFPFVRKISADEMIGFSEGSKCAHISKVFLDSYKSPLSLILIDDIERIIDYVQIGPRFSNTVLQTLLVLLKKDPPTEGHRLMVVATTSVPHLLEDLGGLIQAFNVSLHVPQLQSGDEIRRVLQELVPMSPADMDSIAAAITRPIGIKQLLMITEMARTDEETVSSDRFLECLHTCGY
ncbi:P-loop containing nucleoside triphosphate hydrolase protein [Tribonema minus]|uniref:Vesicle-fusing ATPase n=1 Tax=Tribonema minus TaxID=303371 RepID=A0A835YZT3_9STRA|nr:P-loop containing nucleoside triphosphate hydrolase protein [Tribonema minus]